MPGHDFYMKVFGAFTFGAKGGPIYVLGAKQQALLALLAAAPDGARTRSWLQSHLWTNVQPAQAKGSLRNALSALRRIIGPEADDMIVATRERVTLDLRRIAIVGAPQDGDYLEGLDLRHERAFADWVRERRVLLGAPAGVPAQAAPAGPAHRDGTGPGLLSAGQAPDLLGTLDLLPSIAVLPFRDRAHAGHCPFGDALAEDVSRALSRSRVFTVISHLSCRHFSSMNATLPTVVSELRSRFLVTGETMSHGARFRTNIDFHDARSMKLLWTKEYFGAVEDFLQGEMDLARDVVVQAARSAMAAAQIAAREAPMPSLAVHEMLMASISLMHTGNLEDFQMAKRMLDAAIDRAPGRSTLHAWRGKWHVLKVQKGFRADKAVEAKLAMAETARALDLDPLNSVALSFDGFVHSHLASRIDIAEIRYRQAIEADPNDAFAWLLFGTLHAFRNEPGEAVKFTERARRLSPLDPQRYYFESLSATAQLAAGNYEKALDLANRSMVGNRRHPSTLRVRTIALQRLGRIEEARVAAGELMRQEPDLTVTGYLMRHPAAAFETGRDWSAALGEAGVPG
jgi:TolB-like protein